CGRVAVGYEAGPRLEGPQGRTGPRAKPAVRVADIESAPRQQLLHLQPLVNAQHALVPRPGLRDRSVATEAVCQVADRERVCLGRIVLHDDAKIVEHEEGGSTCAGRKQQEGTVGRARESLAADAPQPATLPLADRVLMRVIGEEIV